MSEKSENERSFWGALESIPRNVIYLVLIAVMIIPLFHPVGLPITVSQTTRSAYDFIEGLPAGSAVMADMAFNFGFYADIGYGAEDVIGRMLARNVRVVMVTTEYQVTVLRVMAAVMTSYVYGKDYVYLGFVPGGESAIASLGSDLWGTTPADYKGTPLNELPVMSNLRKAGDFALALICVDNIDRPYNWIRQWGTTYKVPVIPVATGPEGSLIMPYYPNLVKGALVTARGAAEYELLIRKPGKAVATLDQLNASVAYAFILIVVGNLGYFGRRRRK